MKEEERGRKTGDRHTHNYTGRKRQTKIGTVVTHMGRGFKIIYEINEVYCELLLLHCWKMQQLYQIYTCIQYIQ